MFFIFKEEKLIFLCGILLVINGFYNLIGFVVLVILEGKFLMKEILFIIIFLDWDDLFYENVRELWSIRV